VDHPREAWQICYSFNKTMFLLCCMVIGSTDLGVVVFCSQMCRYELDGVHGAHRL